MARDLTIRTFLKELGMRIGAAVVAIFFGLEYLNRTGFLGLSSLLGTQLAFTDGAFLLVGFSAVVWVAAQRYCG